MIRKLNKLLGDLFWLRVNLNENSIFSLQLKGIGPQENRSIATTKY